MTKIEQLTKQLAQAIIEDATAKVVAHPHMSDDDINAPDFANDIAENYSVEYIVIEEIVKQLNAR